MVMVRLELRSRVMVRFMAKLRVTVMVRIIL